MLKNLGRNIILLSAHLWAIVARPQEIPRDTSDIQVRYFEKGINERYNGSDFNYSLNDTGGVNFIQAVLAKIFGWINDVFGIDMSFMDYRTFELIIYMIMAIGSLYLITRYLLNAPTAKVFRPDGDSFDSLNFKETDITEVDFDDLILKATNAGDYRLATRYLYLKTLKFLTHKNIIQWHFDKTNNDYLNEISNNEIKRRFQRVSYLYDYVWYGEFKIDKSSFYRNKETFENILSSK